MFYIRRPFISAIIDSVNSIGGKRIVNHLMTLNTLPEIPPHQSLLFQHYSESTSLLLKCFNSHSSTSQNNAYQLFANQNPNLQNNVITVFQNDPLFIDIKTKITSIYSTHGQKQFSYMLLPLNMPVEGNNLVRRLIRTH